MPFIIPFGVKVAGSDPIDYDRYVRQDIAGRDALIGSGTEYNGLQVYVIDEQKLYILKDKALGTWEGVGAGLFDIIDTTNAVSNLGTNSSYSGYYGTPGDHINNYIFGDNNSMSSYYGLINNVIAGGSGNSSGSTYSVTGSVISGGDSNVASASYATVSGGFNNNASYIYSTISGGKNNAAYGDHATVGGGTGNSASGYQSTVGGGQGNTASSYYSTVSGGFGNNSGGGNSVIGGGAGNTTDSEYSTIGGGGSNTTNDFFTVIAGGQGNTANGEFTAISGGYGNTASAYGEWMGGLFSTVIAGNTADWVATDRLFNVGNGTTALLRSDAFSILKNGLATLPSVTNALIGAEATGKAVVTREYLEANGGAFAMVDGILLPTYTDYDSQNIVTYPARVSGGALGGLYNKLGPRNPTEEANIYSFITESYLVGGSSNHMLSGEWCTILGGVSNFMGSEIHSITGSTIVGSQNRVSASYSIALGIDGIARTVYETVAGASPTDPGIDSAVWNPAHRLFVIGNGESSLARSDAFLITKEGTITAPSMTEAMITAEATGRALVTREYLENNAGGDTGPFDIDGTNVVSNMQQIFGFTASTNSMIVFGYWHTIENSYHSLILSGGQHNMDGGNHSVIGGGYNNSIESIYSFIAGGTDNSAITGGYSFIGGGSNNVTGGRYSVVPGGRGNTASTYSEWVGGIWSTEVSGNPTAWVATDRLFTVGNGTAFDQRSDAFSILKNGLATLPSVTNALIGAEATGKAVVTREYLEANVAPVLLEDAGSGIRIASWVGVAGHDAPGAFAMDLATGGNGAGATGVNSIAIGKVAYATAEDAISIGPDSLAQYANSTSLGNGASTTKINQVVLGDSNVTEVMMGNGTVLGAASTGLENISGAFGLIGYASGNRTLGSGALDLAATTLYGQGRGAVGNNSIAIGANSNASGVGSISISPGADGPLGAVSSGINSIGIGDGNYVGADNAMAIGAGAGSSYVNSTSLGNAANTTKTNQVVLGDSSVTEIAMGNGTVITGLSTSSTAPATSTAAGTKGEIRIVGTEMFICTATDTWVKTTVTTSW